MLPVVDSAIITTAIMRRACLGLPSGSRRVREVRIISMVWSEQRSSQWPHLKEWIKLKNVWVKKKSSLDTLNLRCLLGTWM